MTVRVLDFYLKHERLAQPAGRWIGSEVMRLLAHCKTELGLNLRVETNMGNVHAAMKGDAPTYLRGLYPALNPAYMPDHPHRYVLVASDRDGVPVATAGWVRDYVEDSYHEAWLDGRLVACKDLRKGWGRNGNYSTCTAPIAREIRGEVVGLYGVWTHPDRRRTGITPTMVRLAYCIAYAVARPAWIVGQVTQKLDNLIVLNTYGFKRAENALTLRVGDYFVEDVRLTANDCAELEAFLKVPDAFKTPNPQEAY